MMTMEDSRRLKLSQERCSVQVKRITEVENNQDVGTSSNQTELPGKSQRQTPVTTPDSDELRRRAVEYWTAKLKASPYAPDWMREADTLPPHALSLTLECLHRVAGGPIKHRPTPKTAEEWEELELLSHIGREWANRYQAARKASAAAEARKAKSAELAVKRKEKRAVYAAAERKIRRKQRAAKSVAARARKAAGKPKGFIHVPKTYAGEMPFTSRYPMPNTFTPRMARFLDRIKSAVYGAFTPTPYSYVRNRHVAAELESECVELIRAGVSKMVNRHADKPAVCTAFSSLLRCVDSRLQQRERFTATRKRAIEQGISIRLPRHGSVIRCRKILCPFCRVEYATRVGHSLRNESGCRWVDILQFMSDKPSSGDASMRADLDKLANIVIRWSSPELYEGKIRWRNSILVGVPAYDRNSNTVDPAVAELQQRHGCKCARAPLMLALQVAFKYDMQLIRQPVDTWPLLMWGYGHVIRDHAHLDSHLILFGR